MHEQGAAGDISAAPCLCITGISWTALGYQVKKQASGERDEQSLSFHPQLKPMGNIRERKNSPDGRTANSSATENQADRLQP